MDQSEIKQLESYLRKKFRLDTIEVRNRPIKDDSVEVYIGDEFIGVLFRDDEDGEVSYDFNMAILAFDLETGS
ncbi:FIG00451007: hypothetical protein [Candidatus Phaeomarinobacter ectocarpi]|uniref:DUF3126 family protein n=1 Tax=Candidatus Phaeomarinibacter ectocarpi TaxID=1458461 RepID=X5MDF2_9HYPH|nr:DUF3126 family protein [Candidatus Phaeomarinobacter ectocarpi]CDO58419.1 FIG00451007: hypothetical protein [Candidatus Phaeomarinobacter ectocarpi]